MMPLRLMCGALLFAAFAGAVAAEEEIRVASVLLRASEQVEAASGEAGLVEAVQVQEGQMVAAGDPLAQIDDDEAELVRARVETELTIAREQAENDVQSQVAEKTLAVAQAELRRNVELNAKFPSAVSQSEIDRLRLLAERSELELQHARHQQRIAQLTVQLKQHELAATELMLRRRKIAAPFAGTVVEVRKHAGEWVEPGDVVMRLLRIDRLRAEGYVEAAALRSSLQGRTVTLTVDLPESKSAKFAGRITFVDPQVDPVNAQVRVWAEIDNRDLRLRPGLKGALSIHPDRGAAPAPAKR